MACRSFQKLWENIVAPVNRTMGRALVLLDGSCVVPFSTIENFVSEEGIALSSVDISGSLIPSNPDYDVVLSLCNGTSRETLTRLALALVPGGRICVQEDVSSQVCKCSKIISLARQNSALCSCPHPSALQSVLRTMTKAPDHLTLSPGSPCFARTYYGRAPVVPSL